MSFYKPRKPTKFRYVYRYYDPKKEELRRKINRSVRKFNPDAPLDPEDIKSNLKGAFHRQSDTLEQYSYDEDFRESIREKTWKSLLFLVILVVFFIWLYASIGEKFFVYLGLNF